MPSRRVLLHEAVNPRAFDTSRTMRPSRWCALMPRGRPRTFTVATVSVNLMTSR